MKKLVVFAFFLILIMSSINSIAEPIIIGDQTIDLYRLTLEELQQLQKSIKDEISRNHEPSSSEESGVLKATKEYVENYYNGLGISVSWPWLDYNYTQEWDHFTLETRVDYKVEKKSQSDRIHAEVERVDNEYILSYLKLGKDVVLDDRDKFQKVDNDQSNNIGTAILETTTDGTVEPTKAITPEPTPEPTLEPTSVPTPEPTPESTQEPTPEPAPSPVFQVRDSGNVNVRSKSNSESPKVGTAIANATYPLISEENGWYQIILEDGTIGWISGKMGQTIGNPGKSENNVESGNASDAAMQTETTSMKKDDDSEREKMHEWAMGQISSWDGSHREFVKLVKKNMNDERSFKHIETNFTEVTDEYTEEYINSVLKSAGFKDRVDIGDLFIIMQFSGKNAFNATVKNTAYGIAFYKTNNLKLLSIE